MRKSTGAGLVIFSLAACPIAAAQVPYGLPLELPPDVMLDKYRDQIERRLAYEHYESALLFMDDIIALHRRNGWPLADEFHFEYGRVAVLGDREGGAAGRARSRGPASSDRGGDRRPGAVSATGRLLR